MKKFIIISSLIAFFCNLSFAHLSKEDMDKATGGKISIEIQELNDAEKATLKELTPNIKDKNTIHVNELGTISFNGTTVSYSLLDALLDEVKEKNASIYLRGDPNVQYKHMNAVVDLILMLKINLSSLE